MSEKLTAIIGLLFFVGIVAVMFGAGLYLRNGPPAPEQEISSYNNFAFVRQDEFWFTQWESDGKLYNLRFRYFPTEVETVPMIGQLNQTFFANSLYITFDPRPNGLQNLTLAAGELSLNLANGLNFDLIPACTNASAPGCEGRPEVTCANSSLSVIYLEGKGAPSVELNDQCITLGGEGRDLLKSVDHLLYRWYRIIQT